MPLYLLDTALRLQPYLRATSWYIDLSTQSRDSKSSIALSTAVILVELRCVEVGGWSGVPGAPRAWPGNVRGLTDYVSSLCVRAL